MGRYYINPLCGSGGHTYSQFTYKLSNKITRILLMNISV